MSTSVLFEIKKLSKIYPQGVSALRNVSFEIQAGEFLVIIGLSGSGKSTLLRCLNRMHAPTQGEIFFQDQEISQLKGEQVRGLQKKMAVIFQHFNLIPRHSVLSNVLMGKLGRMGTLQSLFGLFSDEDRRQALEHLKLVGLSEKANVRADQLSGGQQQRVAIARALMQKPEVLLADEPVASLDPATSYRVMEYLKRINQEMGITVVANLHFLSLVREYATRVIALRDGEIAFNGNPQEIDAEMFEKIYGEGAREVQIR